MPIICPTITAFDSDEYARQMVKIGPFAQRIHIDLMDGVLAPTRSPELPEVWWPEHLTADIHLMYEKPGEVLREILYLHPNLLVFHYEASVDHVALAIKLRDHNVKAGLAILQDTDINQVLDILEAFDHVLIFSGDLGHHGGVANLELLDKVRVIRQRYSGIEVAWDGGINEDNAEALISAGVSVLNVGGYIHNASSPQEAYAKLELLTRTVQKSDD